MSVIFGERSHPTRGLSPKISSRPNALHERRSPFPRSAHSPGLFCGRPLCRIVTVALRSNRSERQPVTSRSSERAPIPGSNGCRRTLAGCFCPFGSHSPSLAGSPRAAGWGCWLAKSHGLTETSDPGNTRPSGGASLTGAAASVRLCSRDDPGPAPAKWRLHRARQAARGALRMRRSTRPGESPPSESRRVGQQSRGGRASNPAGLRLKPASRPPARVVCESLRERRSPEERHSSGAGAARSEATPGASHFRAGPDRASSRSGCALPISETAALRTTPPAADPSR